MALVVENGIVHGKGLTAWKDIARVKMIRDELGPQLTVPRVIRVKSKDFTGSIYLSRAQANQTWEMVRRNMDPDKIEIVTISSADMALFAFGAPIIHWLFGPVGVTLVVLGYLIVRRKPIKRFTWVDYGLLLQVVTGATWVLLSILWSE